MGKDNDKMTVLVLIKPALLNLIHPDLTYNQPDLTALIEVENLSYQCLPKISSNSSVLVKPLNSTSD